MTCQKRGVSALGLQRALGLGSYQTARAMLPRFRLAMVRSGRQRVSGWVEVEEAYVGGVPGRREAPRAARLCKPDWRRFPPAPLSAVRRVFPYTAGSERISVAAFPDMNRSVGAPTRPSDPSGPPGLACRLRRRRRT